MNLKDLIGGVLLTVLILSFWIAVGLKLFASRKIKDDKLANYLSLILGGILLFMALYNCEPQ